MRGERCGVRDPPLVSGSQSVYQVPERFTWLAREADFLSIPNPVVLMLVEGQTERALQLGNALVTASRFGAYTTMMSQFTGNPSNPAP